MTKVTSSIIYKLTYSHVHAAEHSCRGPLSYLRGSRGLRCPRNQPLTLWQLLQRTLARRRTPLVLPDKTTSSWSDSAPLLADWTSLPRHRTAPLTSTFANKTTTMTSNHVNPSQPQQQQSSFVNWHSQESYSGMYLTDNDYPEATLTHREYSEELKRNRRILRAMLALELEEDFKSTVESERIHPGSGMRERPNHSRRRGMLTGYPDHSSPGNVSVRNRPLERIQESSYELNKSRNKSYLDLQNNATARNDGHSDLSNSRHFVSSSELAPLARGSSSLSPRNQQYDLSPHHRSRSSNQNTRKRDEQRLNHHRRQYSGKVSSRGETRTWSAHVIYTTELPPSHDRVYSLP